MSLSTFLPKTERRSLSLAVVNRESPRPLYQMFEALFEGQSVEVEEVETDSDVSDRVYLIDDGRVVASSPLVEIEQSILLVNSDLYITGAQAVDEVEVPSVIDALDDVRFSLRNYPKSHKEKFLLILLSRYVERMAFENNGGTLRTSFQHLSRINDEQGTRSVYERLAGSETEVHLYGVPDWTPPPELEVTVHEGRNAAFRHSWFVVYMPTDPSSQHAALVAVEGESQTWEGFWTYDSDTVRDINRYIEREW